MARAALALLLVLPLATPASAECAWMMWGSTPDGRFIPMLAYATQEACQKESDRIFGNVVKGIENGTNPHREHLLYGYLCYPDTVDPRGPKGARP